ncbi:MAG: A/G-specific adenine glycosylase [Geminicoccaceae bacterium]
MSDAPSPAARIRALPVPRLRADLLAWYDRARRDLPWRAAPGAPADPYAVLVSELMLQQTTVATVRGRFAPFLDRFPTLAALAAAPLEEVLHAWQGLGYYRRARALHACALAVMAEHGGRLPLTAAGLAALPGIGPYTAAAVAAIAGGEAVVPLDANVERVLARLLGLERPAASARPELRAAAQALAAPARAGDLAQALMELGALVCTPRRPGCLACPWRADCRAAASGAPERFPPKAELRARRTCHATAFLLRRPDGACLFRRRPLTGLLGGMIELPTTDWLAEPDELAAAERLAAPAEAAWQAVPGQVRHLFTHIDLGIRLLRAELPATTAPSAMADERLWVPPERFAELALPTLTRKLLRHAGLRW